MQVSYTSTLILTILLAIGLAFFLRAASKDRTTIVDVSSPLPPLEVLNGISNWLEGRGWKTEGGDPDKKILRFNGNVSYSRSLAIFLSILCSLGGGCLGLVIVQLFHLHEWWPLLFIFIGPFAGLFYITKAKRIEFLEIKLLTESEKENSIVRLRAHRDELIAMEKELGNHLSLKSDGSLLSSPI